MPTESKRPMRFGPAPRPRDPYGQFARMPRDPAEVLKEGGAPERWAPGLGVGTAPNKGNRNPELPLKPVQPPFRNLSNGRK